MSGFGDLFGSLSEMLGGLGEVFGERAGEAAIEAGAGALGIGRNDDDDDEPAVYARYLTGAPRALNVNDI